ncbi:hypothetical protein KQI86_07315 [Clostridium sp. MSJ-11]|uniref:Uncharacterized protein n=1 Tax=Clostridium mobile TaxID=2841512 RepID=A0ABS6EI44_9CLOT|nr:hypothetical protein [Clostridium mobile]MBU5484135.1 hypothetical protein [Clostridium mobile]
MNLSKKGFLTISIGLITLVTTIMIYFLLPYTKEGIDTLTFGGIIIAEILSLLFMLVLNMKTSRNKLIISAGVYTTIFLYLIASIGTAIIFPIFFRTALKAYIIIQIILTAAMLAILIITFVMGSRVILNDKNTMEQVSAFKTIENNILLIKDNPKNIEYSDSLRQIYDEIVDCDQSTYVKTDNIIAEKINDLNQLLQSEEVDKQKTTYLIDHILQLIKQRNIEVRKIKMGGI